MRKPPPLSLLFRFPVIGGTGLLAIVFTLLWWDGNDLSSLFMNDLAWHGQPWRLVASALLHVNLVHLAFNLYWLWVFGTLMEAVFGHWKTAALILFLAAGSSAAEYAVTIGGVGLSGVGYGLFAALWVLGRTDERFHAAIDSQTKTLFIVWFFLCCYLTYTDILAIGNVAHLTGAILGALAGLAIVSRGLHRRIAVACFCRWRSSS